MANFTFTRVRDIMRRVIGRRNETDDLSTNNEFQTYIGEFIRDLMPQEIKNFQNFDIYDFNTVNNFEQYTFNSDNSNDTTLGDGSDLDGNIFDVIGPIAFSDETLMNWFTDPGLFHSRWGFDTDVDPVPTAQPTDILFHNDRFTLKPRPDDAYRIRIFGCKINFDETDASGADTIQASSGNDIPENYWGRYVAYGASLDYMYDFGYDFDRIQVVEKRYKHYKALVHGRTFNMFKSNTAIQRF